MVSWFLTEISQFIEEKVIFSTNGGWLMGMLCGHVAEPGSPDAPQLEVPGASRGRGTSSSLGSRGCLGDKLSVTSIFSMAAPGLVWKGGVSPYSSERCPPVWVENRPRVIGNQAHVHIPVCFGAAQYLFLTRSVFWKIIEDLIRPHYWFNWNC